MTPGEKVGERWRGRGATGGRVKEVNRGMGVFLGVFSLQGHVQEWNIGITMVSQPAGSLESQEMTRDWTGP